MLDSLLNDYKELSANYKIANDRVEELEKLLSELQK
jgi:hypothetical protein